MADGLEIGERHGIMQAGRGENWDSMVLSSEGRRLAITSGDGVQIWDLAARTKLAQFRSVNACMAFSPDGKTLVGGTSDGALHLWNVASGSEITTLAALVSSCRAISFSPDGRSLAAAEVANAIKLWVAPDFEETDRPLPQPKRR